jgi:hypothetical protein|tara:strand:+ start:2862 stop:3128 length:267 start_codon:yes stop_codon:yes gene_type:complete
MCSDALNIVVDIYEATLSTPNNSDVAGCTISYVNDLAASFLAKMTTPEEMAYIKIKAMANAYIEQAHPLNPNTIDNKIGNWKKRLENE